MTSGYVVRSVETSQGRWQLRVLANGESRGFLSVAGCCNLESAEGFSSKEAADEAIATRVRVKEGTQGPEYFLERVRAPTKRGHRRRRDRPRRR